MEVGIPRPPAIVCTPHNGFHMGEITTDEPMHPFPDSQSRSQFPRRARARARFRLPRGVVALSPDPSTAQALQFKYGVCPVNVDGDRADLSGG